MQAINPAKFSHWTLNVLLIQICSTSYGEINIISFFLSVIN